MVSSAFVQVRSQRPAGVSTNLIRTESPALHKSRNAISGRRRSRFRVISDRVRSGSSETSYTAHRTSDIDTAILGVCRQIHREACHVLYSEHTFDFDIDVESIVPFFRDLTPAALASVESIRFVKRALPYCKEFDRCEWRSACAFLATQMRLRRVNLTVVGGRPGPVWGAPVGEWESQAPWKFDDFDHVMQNAELFDGVEVQCTYAEFGLRDSDSSGSVMCSLSSTVRPRKTAGKFDTKDQSTSSGPSRRLSVVSRALALG
ncbi:MAG: hypothetical protein Q9200_000120 [Gallowayella weberi]